MRHTVGMTHDVLMLLLTISCLIAFATALVVFINDIASAAHRWLGLLLIFGSLWSLVINFQNAALSLEYNLWIVRLTFIMALGMVICMVYFAKNIAAITFSHLINGFVVITASIAVLLTLLGVMIPGVYVEGTTIRIERGLAYYVLISYILLLGLGSVALLVWARQLLGQKQVRKIQQLSVVSYGLTAGIVIGILTNVVLPNVTGSIFPARFAWIAVLLWTSFLTFALVRFKFMDIKLAAVRSSAYILTLATLGVMYYVVAYFTSQFFLNGEVILVSPLSVVLALLLTIIFQPVKKFFDKATNRFFYQDDYNLDDFYATFNHVLASSVDLRNILQRAAHELAVALKAESCYFFLYYNRDASSTRHYLSAGTEGYQRLSPRDAEVLHELVEKMTDENVIVKSLLDEQTALYKLLDDYAIELLMPLRHEGKIIGFLMLASRKVGRYGQRDSDVLTTVSNSLIIAIQNALSVHTVKELNATLQQRVDAATEQLRKSNAELQKLDSAKDEFLSIASHQLRTPLTSVKGYISMLLDGDAGRTSETQRYLLSEAFKGSERMVGLINDFLNVSRMQSGRFMLDYKKFDIVDLVRQEVDNLRDLAASRGETMSFSATSDVCVIEADENKLRQIIMNYIDNAIYYSKPHSTIRITVDVTKTTVEVKVIDTGIGVPASEQAKLFTKFFRAGNAKLQRPDGTGVGIYLAKRVIAEHGGKILFESKEGKGSMFGFALPRKPSSMKQNDAK